MILTGRAYAADRERIGIWLGVLGPKAVRPVGAKADGWSVSAPYVPPERVSELNILIVDPARPAGRVSGLDLDRARGCLLAR